MCRVLMLCQRLNYDGKLVSKYDKKYAIIQLVTEKN